LLICQPGGGRGKGRKFGEMISRCRHGRMSQKTGLKPSKKKEEQRHQNLGYSRRREERREKEKEKEAEEEEKEAEEE